MITSLIAAMLFQAAPAAAPCTESVAPPAGLEAWSKASEATIDTIAPGKAADLALRPASGINFALPPERAPATGTFGGVYRVTIATAGTYRIALSGGAWIDLVDHAAKTLKSAGHTEGAACSGIRKIVDFPLDPGTYTLQLSGANTAGMRVLIVPR